MDEPLGALDAFTRESIQELVLDVWHRDRQDGFLHHPQRRGGAVPRHASDRDDAATRAGSRTSTGWTSARRFIATRDARAVKSAPDFIRVREEVLAVIQHRAAGHRDDRADRAPMHATRRRRAPRARRPRSTRRTGEGTSTAISVVTMLALFALWWLASHLRWVPPLFLPTPETVVHATSTSPAIGEAHRRAARRALRLVDVPRVQRVRRRLPDRDPGRHRHGRLARSRAASSIRRSSSTGRCRRSPICRSS